ncbi:hypothetical protein TrVE_jg10579 [Triparma verrucosa]|uniref:Uncharacterized protein n=1 Tax=Triparma verrucosa TaxID=1606542 RepID=A0A9W7B9D1_9STRA|nr:hypothetical protein TrVE_jg10579 [Triparma verrucosa]
MRTSYSTLDNFNIIPMSQFQRDFFLIRSSLLPQYTKSLPNVNVPQGDLTNPNYFDFISFSQYTTILRTLKDPSIYSIESQPVLDEDGEAGGDFKDVAISIRDDLRGKDVFEVFRREVGEEVLGWLKERGEVGGGKGVEGVGRILDLFKRMGYVTDWKCFEEKGFVVVETEGNVNDWGIKCLKKEKLDNDFIRMVVEAWGREEGNETLVYVKNGRYKIVR